MLSRPLRVEWAGWVTDTFRLQQAGWKLSAEQDFYERRMRIAMVHEGLRMQAMSDRSEFDYERFHRSPMDLRDLPPLIVRRAMGSEVRIHEAGRIDWNFQPIDAQPCMTSNRISRMEDLCHFAAPLVRSNEVIIPNESVPELMERILKLQQPARTDRIREDMRNPEGLIQAPQQKFHAQIISLAA